MNSACPWLLAFFYGAFGLAVSLFALTAILIILTMISVFTLSLFPPYSVILALVLFAITMVVGCVTMLCIFVTGLSYFAYSQAC